MCILFFAIEQHPDYPLIIAANRDEYYARPSQPMHYWPDQPSILAGRDRRAQGSWLGINRHGRFCAVTNLHQPRRDLSDSANQAARAEVQSRGELVARYLRQQDSAAAFQRYLQRAGTQFKPFNLIFGRRGALVTFSSQAAKCSPLAAGWHAISNAAPGHTWPKMSRGIAQLAALINPVQRVDVEALLAIMQDARPAADAALPPSDMPASRQRARSSIFIRDDDYGTRSTTLLLFSPTQAAPGRVEVHELTFTENARPRRTPLRQTFAMENLDVE